MFSHPIRTQKRNRLDKITQAAILSTLNLKARPIYYNGADF